MEDDTRELPPLHYEVEAWRERDGPPPLPRRTRTAAKRPPWERQTLTDMKAVVDEPPRVRVAALVPAYNEADSIAATVGALRAQQHRLDEIVVIINNCTDGTEKVVAGLPGVTALVMEHNPHLKAGALNYALERLLPGLDDEDLVLIQDADTILNPDFMVNAMAAMRDDIGGVCAQYDSPAPANLLERLQANEFARSRRRIARNGGGTKILVGIASVFRVAVLREVIEARRDGRLPGPPAVYNPGSLTEDYELTLALKTLGYRLVCPPGCRPQTHAMPTVGKLWGQRTRWTRGALDDLQLYGVTRVTRGYLAAQVSRMIIMLMPLLYGLYLLSLQETYGRIAWDLPWALVNVLFITERVVTVREEGWRAMLLSALLLPELAYDWFMSASYINGLVKHLSDEAHEWKET